jgi:glycosyltransferase involved in cell wall biosynthesis
MGYFVSVIIPVYNSASTLEKCLDSIFKSEYKDYEVIVVDDASTDNSMEIVKRFNCEVIKLSKNLGAANARNNGAKKAKGEIIFFTDGDCVVQTETISTIVKIFEKNRDLAAIIGSYTLTTPVRNFITTFHNLRHHYTHQTSRQEAMTFWTGCGAIKREVFEIIGGFDIEFKAATIEDIELGYRLSSKGYKIQLNKDVMVTHLKKYNFVKLIKTDVINRAIPWTRLMLESRTFRSDLNTTKLNGVAMMMVYGIALLILFSFLSWKFLIPIPFMFGIFALIHGVFYKWVLENFGRKICFGVVLMSPIYFLYSGVGLMGGIASYLKSRIINKKK